MPAEPRAITLETALRDAIDLLARVVDTVPGGTPMPDDFDATYDSCCAALGMRVSD